MMIKEKLVTDARDFCHRKGISLSTLAAIVVNNPSLFSRLENNKTCSIDTADRFFAVFKDDSLFERLRARKLNGLQQKRLSSGR